MLALLFAGPLLLAFLLNEASWRPQQTRNNGELVDPPVDVSTAPVTLRDGGKLVWRDPQWQWTLLALPGTTCAQACRERLDEMVRMRITLGRNAERVRIVYLGPDLGADFVAARAPLLAGNDDNAVFASYRTSAVDGLALLLVDPNGLLMLRYREGYAAQGVRKDLKPLLHIDG
jgi:hypothetical protein